MYKVRKDFSEILRLKMKEKNITQIELSRAIDVSDTSIYRYLNGLAYPRPLLMDRLIKVFKCPSSDFYDV